MIVITMPKKVQVPILIYLFASNFFFASKYRTILNYFCKFCAQKLKVFWYRSAEGKHFYIISRSFFIDTLYIYYIHLQPRKHTYTETSRLIRSEAYIILWETLVKLKFNPFDRAAVIKRLSQEFPQPAATLKDFC